MNNASTSCTDEMDKYPVLVGANLKRIRKAKKLKQNYVAEMMNYSPQTLRRYEQGKISISIQELIRLSHFYQVEMNEFFRGIGYEEEKLPSRERAHRIIDNLADNAISALLPILRFMDKKNSGPA